MKFQKILIRQASNKQAGFGFDKARSRRGHLKDMADHSRADAWRQCKYAWRQCKYFAGSNRGFDRVTQQGCG